MMILGMVILGTIGLALVGMVVASYANAMSTVEEEA